jgi:peptide/nickel transport system substrate-binding protein
LDTRTLRLDLDTRFRFADGRPVVADDVRATYEAIHRCRRGVASTRHARLARPGGGAGRADRRSCGSSGRTPLSSTRPGWRSCPRTGARDSAEVTIGAGPYRLVDARRGDRIVLAPNPYWPDGPPTIDPLVLRIVPDAVVRVLELERGGVGFLQELLEPEILDRLRTAPRLAVSTTPGTSVAYLIFNFRDPRLRDRRVRRAIASAVDPALLVRSLLGPTGRPATGILTPEHWAFASTPHTRPSLRRARRLLDRAGWIDPDGGRPRGPHADRLQNVQPAGPPPARRGAAGRARPGGIALDVRTYEWGTLFADIRTGNFEMAAMTWVGVADPDLYRLAYHSAMVPPAGMNRGRYASRAMDRLTELGRRTLDSDVRRTLYGRVQRWAAHDLPVLPLWWEERVVVATARLHGLHAAAER